MDFKSARFVGNPTLEDILNDPPTGNLVLGPTSAPADVIVVQQALLDLSWPAHVQPAITYDNFADGLYGPKTEATVLAYKRSYWSYIPPTAPAWELIDSLVGPTTLRRLDAQIAFYDESRDAIDAKITELNAVADVENDSDYGDYLSVVRGRSAVMRFVSIDGTTGVVVNTRDLGTFEVHGAIFAKYYLQVDWLGMPTSDEHDGPPGTRESDFEHGVLRCDLSTGEVETVNIGDPQPAF